MYFAAFFKKEFINNKSIIFNYKKEMIGELKADDSNKQRCQRLMGVTVSSKTLKITKLQKSSKIQMTQGKNSGFLYSLFDQIHCKDCKILELVYISVREKMGELDKTK